MATIIRNQATLNYRYGTATASTMSNVTSTVLGSGLTISKTSLTEEYRVGQNVTYIISITNMGSATGGVTVRDNLGTYTLSGNEYTPLTYVGPARLFINGVFDSVITPTSGTGNVTFEIPSIPAGGNAQILYQARVNEYASGESDATITNTVTADCNCPCDVPVTDSHTITTEDYADVRIVKSVCPNPVICEEEITYIFDIYNYGNIPATEVVLTDTFTPPLTDITVTLDGVVIPETEYSYVNGVLALPATDSEFEITVPAATFARNPQTGSYVVTPGHIQIIVTGNI